MRRSNLLTALGITALIFLCPGMLWGQNAVVNGDFESGNLSPMWTLSGGNTYTQVVIFKIKPINTSYCVKGRPGPPSSNGAFEQDVFLTAGIPYNFSAEITAQYCSS